jgi:hypothetical protein
MNDKEFIKEIYELAYGDSAFDKEFITGHEEVLAKMQYYTELSHKAEGFIRDAEGL